MSDLGTAVAITAEAFKSKKDKGGQPYILHCLHVMNKLKYTGDEELMCAAVMHDLVEDTDYTLDDLRKLGFSRRVVDLVNVLTHRDNEDYMTYIEKIKKHGASAVSIKLNDLRHNSDITRMKGLRDKDIARIEKYHRAYAYLSN